MKAGENMEERIATFGARLCEAMNRQNIKSVDLARISGVSQSDISNYRAGRYEASQVKLQKLAEALDVSIPWLMGFDVPLTSYQRILATSENDAFRDRMKAEYGALFDLVEKADEKQRQQIETIIRTIVGDDDPDDWGA